MTPEHVLAESLLDTFRHLEPQEFKALWNAKHLPKSGIHCAERAPGHTDNLVIRRLLEQGLIQANPDRPQYFILTHLGKLLMGAVYQEE